MSTIKVTNLQHASAASPAIVLASDSTATLNGLAYPTSGSLSGRNRIINGDMRIDQRNAGTSVTPGGGATYLVDRWALAAAQASKVSCQQNAGSVTPPAGFTNYLGATSLSAYSVVAGDYFTLQQSVEGFNVSDLGWGTANAKPITVSFWVRSSLTGSFGGAINNNGSTRNYPFLYTISSANTWEYKTITVPGDTSGTWLTTNGIGLTVNFAMGMGSTYSGTAGAWTGTANYSVTGATSVVGTNGATFYITGVQLEAGSVATPFERRSYGQELLLCQRYYQKSYAQGTVPGTSVTGTYNGLVWSNGVCDSGLGQVIPFTVVLPVPLRATPSLSYWDAAGNVSKFSTFTGGGFARTDNQGGFGGTYLASDAVLAGYGAPGAGNSYAFAYVASSEL